jgi:chemotaxis regulatin CheY-phosphate phosphatase CheZ
MFEEWFEYWRDSGYYDSEQFDKNKMLIFQEWERLSQLGLSDDDIANLFDKLEQLFVDNLGKTSD